MLAWLAQALLPVAHATAMAGPTGAGGNIWCGDATAAAQALALLPSELRAALDDGNVQADRLADCSLLCALGSASALPVGTGDALGLRDFRPEPAVIVLSDPSARSQASPPPAHAPPTRY